MSDEIKLSGCKACDMAGLIYVMMMECGDESVVEDVKRELLENENVDFESVYSKLFKCIPDEIKDYVTEVRKLVEMEEESE